MTKQNISDILTIIFLFLISLIIFPLAAQMVFQAIIYGIIFAILIGIIIIIIWFKSKDSGFGRY